MPASAVATFTAAWLIASLSQPFNAIAFITDGIHWGTSDYRYLRNGMFLATVSGAFLLFLIDPTGDDAFRTVWTVTFAWIVIRAVIGAVRVWPGIGRAPLGGAAIIPNKRIDARLSD